MTPGFGLIPSDVSTNTAIAIGAIALVSGTARGFSGFGSALIFMPLASSLAAPRLIAAVLLMIDFVAAVPLIPNAWRQADRSATAVMVSGALIGVPLGTYFLSRLDPVTTRWIISAFVFALLLLLISGWRYRGKDHSAISVGIGGLSGFCSGLAQTGGPPIVGYWLGRPVASAIARTNILLFFGASDFFSAASYAFAGLVTAEANSVFTSDRSGLWHRGLVGRIFVRPRQRETLPLNLLCVNCGGRRDRVAGAGSFATLEPLCC